MAVAGARMCMKKRAAAKPGPKGKVAKVVPKKGGKTLNTKKVTPMKSNSKKVTTKKTPTPMKKVPTLANDSATECELKFDKKEKIILAASEAQEVEVASVSDFALETDSVSNQGDTKSVTNTMDNSNSDNHEAEAAIRTFGTALKKNYGDFPVYKILVKVYEPLLRGLSDVTVETSVEPELIKILGDHMDQVQVKVEKDEVIVQNTLEVVLPDELSQLEHQKQEGEATLEKANNQKDSKTEQLQEAEASLKEARSKLKAANSAQKEKEAFVKEKTTEFERVHKMKSEIFDGLAQVPTVEAVQQDQDQQDGEDLVKGETLAQVQINKSDLQKQILSVVKVLKTVLCVEDGLLAALPVALKKSGSDRGNFDLITIQECTSALQKWLNERNEMLTVELPKDLEEASELIKECEAEVEKGVNFVATSKAELQTATAELEQARSDLDKLMSELAEHPKKVTAAQKRLATLKANLEHIREAIRGFHALGESQSKKVEEEEVQESNDAQMEVVSVEGEVEVQQQDVDMEAAPVEGEVEGEVQEQQQSSEDADMSADDNANNDDEELSQLTEA